MWQLQDILTPKGRALTGTALLAALAIAAGGAQSAWAGVDSVRGGRDLGASNETSAQQDSQSSGESPASDESEKSSAPAEALPTTKEPERSAPRVQSWTRSQKLAANTPEPAPVIVQQRTVGDQGEAEAEGRAAPIPYLVPGSGFAGPTVEPQPVGDLRLPGADAKAIAHWDVVPEQIISGDFQVGVVAFHINGIDRVEFSLNGGPWLSAYEMRENKITGVWEYMVRLSARDLTDGPFHLRAIAYPRLGQPRLLDNLVLIANAGGSVPQGTYYVAVNGNDETGDGSKQRPFATIWKAASLIEREQGAPYYASNGTILLFAGDHKYAGKPQNQARVKTGTGWLTIMAAPGVSPDRVRIVGNSAVYGGLYSGRVRFKNLTIAGCSLKTDTTYTPAAWFDKCTLEGTGPGDEMRFASVTSWTGGAYHTDCMIRNVAYGSIRATMLRGCTMENIGSDAFRDPRLVLNCRVNGIRKPAGSGFHPDLIQFWGNFDNVILYGIEAHEIFAQGIFSEGKEAIADKNIALVNVAIDQRSHLSQWSQAADHVLLWNVTLLGQPFLVRNVDDGRPKNVMTNFSVRDSVFQEMRATPSIIPANDQTVFQNNHFINGVTIGRNATSGDAGFEAATGQLRFSPGPNSPLANRVMHPLAPADAVGDPRPTPAAIGAVDAE